MPQNSSSLDVAVIGIWHLGSVSAAAWTATGHSVIAWDADENIRSAIATGRGLVVEPDLDEHLQTALVGGRLAIAPTIMEALASAPVTHLAYDTAVDDSGRPSDPRLDLAIEAFAAGAPDGALLLISSQLTVGTCERWRRILEAQERGLLIAHVPENLRLGRAVEDFLHPERLLIGADDDASWEQASSLLAPFSATPLRMGLAAAEMAKHATNTYLALCVAFANELAWLALAAGADPQEVIAGLRADPRVSPSAPLRPGTAFSGATLARDLITLRDLGAACGRSELFDAVITANERHANVALTWLEASVGELRGAHIAVAGLTYKPGTSTLRDSLPLRLVDQLLARGASVSVWDPNAEAIEHPAPGLTRAPSLEACVRDADALTVMTALPELAAVDWASLRPARRLLIDGCVCVDRESIEAAGWTYHGLAVNRRPLTPTRDAG
jgi:UDPglucose 6-dehydrogenase